MSGQTPDLRVAEAYVPKLTMSQARLVLSSPDLVMGTEGKRSVVYAPFDHIMTGARVAIVGITPGETQAANAIRAAVSAREAGADLAEVLSRAKATASFSGGVMRSNLIRLLEGVGLHTALGLPSAAKLFMHGSTDVHLTSALRYPVFKRKADGELVNYNGPDPLRSPMLRKMIEIHLAEEARALPRAIWIPLGPVADLALSHLVSKGVLDTDRVLTGMPHPSGANGGPINVFLGGTPKPSMPVAQAERLMAARASITGKLRNLSS